LTEATLPVTILIVYSVRFRGGRPVPGIIGIIQVKGGVGRSTIATNLAATLSLQHPTALIDCDMPQGTSASWYALRQSEVPSNALVLATAHNHRELVQRARECAERCTYLVIDGPPRLAEMTRAIIMLSDLSLVPLGASAAEIWSTTDLLRTLDEARICKPTLDARIVWTRFRGHTREAQELKDAVEQELRLKELRTTLGYRVAYSEALARGLSAEEWLDPQAHGEIQSLGSEGIKILREKNR
jgi:chromosome partitioning protein